METVSMKLFPRTPGKKYVNEARKKGLLPVNVYGKLLPANITGSVERIKMVKALHSPKGRNVIVTLEAEDKKVVAIPYRIDIDPVKNVIAHIDFLAISENEMLTVNVPLVKEGRSQGEVVGGRALQVLKEISVRCLPVHIPEKLTVDVTPYDIGQRIMVNDLKYPEGVTPNYRDNPPAIVVNKGRGQSADEATTAEGEAAPADGAAAPAADGKKPAAGTDAKKPAEAEAKPAEKGKKK
ncbi:MAG TPA: 50S ribosomal protein L25 [bacterium]|nr:50S ribosomal protein L25 [bacterium]